MLCAGAVMSPHLLLLSGIGPGRAACGGTASRSSPISPASALACRDHPQVFVGFELGQSMPRRTGGWRRRGRTRHDRRWCARGGDAVPDADGRTGSWLGRVGDRTGLGVLLHRADSSVEVSLASADPEHAPTIDYHSLESAIDRSHMAERGGDRIGDHRLVRRCARSDVRRTSPVGRRRDLETWIARQHHDRGASVLQRADGPRFGSDGGRRSILSSPRSRRIASCRHLGVADGTVARTGGHSGVDRRAGLGVLRRRLVVSAFSLADHLIAAIAAAGAGAVERDRRRRHADLVPHADRARRQHGRRQRHQHGRAVPRLLRRRSRATVAAARSAGPSGAVVDRRRSRRAHRLGAAAGDGRGGVHQAGSVADPAGMRACSAARTTSASGSASAPARTAHRARSLSSSTFLVSIYGGYFGAGLGIALLAVLGLVIDETLPRLNALKQVLALVINVVAACFFAGSGQVIWSLVAVMAPASLLGGVAGGKLVNKIKPAVLRAAVVTYGTVLAVYYLRALSRPLRQQQLDRPGRRTAPGRRSGTPSRTACATGVRPLNRPISTAGNSAASNVSVGAGEERPATRPLRRGRCRPGTWRG